MPIAALTPQSTSWKIKARVLKKAEVKYFNNAQKNTNGCLFSIDIMDFKGVEIQCTFFNEAADKFYDQLIEGVVYEFGNG